MIRRTASWIATPRSVGTTYVAEKPISTTKHAPAAAAASLSAPAEDADADDADDADDAEDAEDDPLAVSTSMASWAVPCAAALWVLTRHALAQGAGMRARPPNPISSNTIW